MYNLILRSVRFGLYTLKRTENIYTKVLILIMSIIRPSNSLKRNILQKLNIRLKYIQIEIVRVTYCHTPEYSSKIGGGMSSSYLG